MIRLILSFCTCCILWSCNPKSNDPGPNERTLPKRISTSGGAVYDFTYYESKLESFTLSSSTDKEVVTLTRNNNGFVTSALIEKNGVATNNFFYERDNFGQLIRMRYNSRISYPYKYDDNGYLTSINLNGTEYLFKQDDGNIIQFDQVDSQIDQSYNRTITFGSGYEYDGTPNPFYLINGKDGIFPFLGLTLDKLYLLTSIPSVLSKNNILTSPSTISSPVAGGIGAGNPAVKYEYSYGPIGWTSRKTFRADYSNQFKTTPSEVVQITY